jgi:hypothetical protein
VNITPPDSQANAAATFIPATDEGTGPPAISIAGALVFAYVENGILRVSIDLDEAGDPAGPFALYGNGPADRDCIPVHITCQGTDVFRAGPEQAEY